ncbi:glutaredoxin domain-containing protein [Streptomyces sp. NPDC087305]|uniref:glutaredoxin domain-containing protein n=1 Tax=Streptomyces sp. NPDC087305 TaxID=3365781 RepID=UPI00381F7A9E
MLPLVAFGQLVTRPLNDPGTVRKLAVYAPQLRMTETNAKARGSDVSEESGGVVVYWRPRCPYCIKLLTQLRFTQLEFTKVNIWKHPDAAAFVRSVADGNETVPTVTVAGRAMVNPSKGELLEAVRAYAPHLLSGAADGS